MFQQFTKLMFRKVDGIMSQDELLERILGFLKGQTMCTLCTCNNNIPRATPLEYYNNGTTLYIVAHPGQKIDNIKANPQVSVAIYNEAQPIWTDGGNWLGANGVQITGRARVIHDDDPEYFEALMLYRSPWLAEQKLPDRPMGRMMIVVESERIDLIQISLKYLGYAGKQVWIAPGKSSEPHH